jgi:hypothetical protein
VNAFKSFMKQTHCLTQVHHYEDVCQHTTHALLGFSYQLMCIMSKQIIYATSTINFSRKKYISLAAIFHIRLVSNTLFLNQSHILWHRIFIFHPFHRRHWLAIRTWAFHTHWHLYLTRGICEMHNTILSSKSKGIIYRCVYIYIYKRTTHFKF